MLFRSRAWSGHDGQRLASNCHTFSHGDLRWPGAKLAANKFVGLGDTMDRFHPRHCFEHVLEFGKVGADGSGAKIARVLELEATRSGVEIRRGSRVGSLEREAEGFRVEMASSDEVDVRRAVVIATGGFGASREMLAKHYPTAT